MTQPVPVFTGRVAQGKVEWDSPAEAARWTRTLEGERIQITIRKWRGRRTDNANRYYWGVVVALIAEHCGYDPEECHDALKLLFLTDHGSEGPLPHVKSTASLNTTEFCDYIDRVRAWAATDLGVVIPDPNSVEAA